LAEDGQLHPLQAAFLETGAAQCGFCTPGLLIRAYALLQAQPDPDEAAVRVALGGNICRCTGYVKPVEAVLEAARRMRAAAADATRQGSVEPGLPASDSALR
jgi:carbon-monoxide dehydrogenase small subunit